MNGDLRLRDAPREKHTDFATVAYARSSHPEAGYGRNATVSNEIREIAGALGKCVLKAGRGC